jgi:hypothetical protein
MEISVSEKLRKELTRQNRLYEYDVAVKAIRWVEAGRPEYQVAVNFLNSSVSAGEYLTLRNLWKLINKKEKK